MIMGMITHIRTITVMTTGMFITSTTGMSSVGTRGRIRSLPGLTQQSIPLSGGWFRGSRPQGTRRSWAVLAFAAVPALVSPAVSQPSSETLRVENEYRECLYSKSRSGRYAHGERESDFGLLGECRNQWVAYMDVCTKTGFDNATCVMKSRLVIHAILNLTGK
jgi:hypothetical protein